MCLPSVLATTSVPCSQWDAVTLTIQRSAVRRAAALASFTSFSSQLQSVILSREERSRGTKRIHLLCSRSHSVAGSPLHFSRWTVAWTWLDWPKLSRLRLMPIIASTADRHLARPCHLISIWQWTPKGRRSALCLCVCVVSVFVWLYL